MNAFLSQVTNYLAEPSARFSSDGKFLFYLMRHDSPASPSELRTDLRHTLWWQRRGSPFFALSS
jgi:hypothetical protein